MAFWGGSKLLADGQAMGIVEPFYRERIDGSAYELTLGAEAYVTPSHGDDLRKNGKEKLDAPEVEEVGGKHLAKGGGTIKIPAGQFAFLLTEEIISLPVNVMGFISLKSKPKFRGLINVSGFHVDPGFKGRLIYSVFNAGPSLIHLARGDRLFLLWIADLAGTKLEDYAKKAPGYVDIPSSIITDVSRERHSLQALSEKVDALSENVRLIKFIAAGLISAVALVFITWL